MLTRTLVKSRRGKVAPQFWTITLDGNKVITEWGIMEGAVQTTTQEFEGLNIGRANEKSPEKVAQEFFERQIMHKNEREGYRDIEPNGFICNPVEEFIDFSKPLPSSARFYKPQNSMSKGMLKLCEEKKSWYVRKRNGEMLIAVKHDDFEWRLYSSKVLMFHRNEPGIPWSDRFPHIMDNLNRLDLPPGTIILGELVASRHEDDLNRVGSVTKSLCERALELQKDKPLHYCLWDLAFVDHESWLETKTYRQRYYRLSELLGILSYTPPYKYEYLSIAECFAGQNIDEMLKKAKELKWEGYVTVNPDVLYGDKALNFRGKAERPAACNKLKPLLEGDFIARWDPDNGVGERGKGKKSGGVGSLAVYLMDDSGNEVFISNVGGGLTDEKVFELADPSLYPLVCQIEFTAWTSKGSLQFPQFIRTRDDKTIEECTLEQRPDLEDLEDLQ